jgi:hypothetical protein
VFVSFKLKINKSAIFYDMATLDILLKVTERERERLITTFIAYSSSICQNKRLSPNVI